MRMQVKKMASLEAIVLQWLDWSASWDFEVVKEQQAGALLSVKCCCFVWKSPWKSHAEIASLKEKKKKERKKNILATW